MIHPDIKDWVDQLVDDFMKHTDKSKDNKEYYLSFMKESLDLLITGGNQIKYPASTHTEKVGAKLSDAEIAKLEKDKKKETTAKIYKKIKEDLLSPPDGTFKPKKDKAGIVRAIDTTDYTSEETIQQLRWLSSYAYAWLYQHNLNEATGNPKPMEEVQTLWDGDKIYLCENNKGNTEALKKMFDSDIDLNKPMAANAALDRRIKRHVKDLISTRKGDSKLIDTFFDGKTNNKIQPVIDGGRDKHAEVRLAEVWIKDVKSRGVQKPNASVSGIKRPCLACYSRLKVLARTDGITLNHKPRPGLFWPTGNAIKDIDEAATKEILKYIASFEPYFVAKDGAYVHDSDSDMSDLEEVERNKDGSPKKERKVNIFDDNSRKTARKALGIVDIDDSDSNDDDDEDKKKKPVTQAWTQPMETSDNSDDNGMEAPDSTSGSTPAINSNADPNTRGASTNASRLRNPRLASNRYKPYDTNRRRNTSN